MLKKVESCILLTRYSISSDPVADFQRKTCKNSVQKRDETDGGETADGYIEQLYKLKEKNRNLKTLLSIGGANYSQAGKFEPATQTTEGRRRFAKSAVNLVASWGLDGVDIDWEFPKTKEEAQNYVQLLNETRSALDEYAARNGQKYHYVLSAATSAAPFLYKVLDFQAMDRYLDIWNLMAYDYAGFWDNTTGHQANVYADADNMDTTKYSTNQAVDDYIAAGVTPEKVVLGMPLYGRPFTNTTGMGQKFVSAGERSGESDVWPYNELPMPGSTVFVDETLVAAYNYDAESGLLISYDNTDTAALKAKYLVQKGLGGAVFWEASGDQTGEESLIRAMANNMSPLEDAQNMLNYPQSEFRNIRGPEPS
jgi:chitinase